MHHPRERFAGSLSRRRFLKGGVVAAATLPTAGALLAACGDSKPSSDSDVAQLQHATREEPATFPITDSNPAIGSDLPVESGATLKLFNWDAYMNRKVVTDFEKKFDCKVETSTFGTWDEGIAKIKSGQGDWDIYFPSFDLIDKLQLAELVQPLNHDYLPNLAKNIWPQFGGSADQPFYDVGSHYSVPYTLFTTGIGYRNDLVAAADQPEKLERPWDLLWNPKYKGKLGMYDDWGTTMGVAMFRNGFTDINNAGQAEVDAAVAALLDAIEKTDTAFGINITYEDLPKGVFVATTAWSGDMTSAPYYGKESPPNTAPLLSYWYDPTIGYAGSDCMVILKQAQNPVLAHQFLNYMMDEDVAFKNMGWVGYQHPQNAIVPDYFRDRSNKWSWIVYPNLLNTIATPKEYDAATIFYDWPAAQSAMWAKGWEVVMSGAG